MTHHHIPLPDLLAQVAIDDLGGYSTHHLMQLWGVKRARISALAKRYQWQVVGKIGQSNVYAKENVEAYMTIRNQRSD